MPEAQGGGVPYIGTHYGDTSVAEDVSEMIYQLTPEDTPFYNSTEDTTSNGVFHQWQSIAIGGRTHNANYEGSTFLFTAGMQLVDPRRFNITQIFNKMIRVSGTEVALQHYGIANIFLQQMKIRGAELKMDIEHSILNSTIASGASGTARVQQGIINFVVSGVSTYTTHAAGVTITETHFNDFQQTCWEYGSKPKDWFMHGKMRRRISGFVAGQTKFVNVEAYKSVNTQSVYESDFNVVKLHLCRDVPYQTATGAFSGYTGYGLLGVDLRLVKKAWLRRIEAMRTPKIADSFDGVMMGEMCIEGGHPNAHYYLKGSLTG